MSDQIAIDRTCEACGINLPTKQIRTTNGSLFLCDLCLSDINRKNPETKRLHAEKAALHASLIACKDAIQDALTKAAEASKP